MTEAKAPASAVRRPADRAYYAAQSPERRAALALDMASEVLDHYDHARALVAALVTELRSFPTEETKPALQLATVTEAWLNDLDHRDQELRLTACLQAVTEASHG